MRNAKFITTCSAGIVFFSLQILIESGLHEPVFAVLAGLGQFSVVAALLGLGAALLAYHRHFSRRGDRR